VKSVGIMWLVQILLCALAFILLFVFVIFVLAIFHWLRARARDEIIASRLNLTRNYCPEKDLEKVKKKIRDGKF
jgi:ABC-type bacteriocin/lantibiotic exporter with double-glycine peptidase domain